MFSSMQRINYITAQATTVIITVLIAISITTFIIPNSLSPCTLKLSKLRVYQGQLRTNYYDRKAKELVAANFDLKADLSPLFNWNTKQVFVYLKAEYETAKHPNNQVVVYDRIIRTPQAAKINLSGAKFKYDFNEITDSFKNVTATFSLHYDIMPHVGVLTSGEIVRTEPITFPSKQSRV